VRSRPRRQRESAPGQVAGARRSKGCGASAGKVVSDRPWPSRGKRIRRRLSCRWARRLSYLARQPQSGSATSRLARRWRIGGAAPAAPPDAFPVWRARHARSNGRRPRPCRRWRCAIDQRQSW